VKQRPIGVIVYAVLFLIGAATPLYLSIMAGLQMLQGQLSAPEDLAFGVTYLVMGGVFGLYLICTGIGLLLLKRWSRWLALLSALISSAFIIYVGVTSSDTLNTIRNLLVILGWNGVMIWYFLRPSVKAQFVSRER